MTKVHLMPYAPMLPICPTLPHRRRQSNFRTAPSANHVLWQFGIKLAFAVRIPGEHHNLGHFFKFTASAALPI